MNIKKGISLIKTVVILSLFIFGLLLPIDFAWPFEKTFIFSIVAFFIGIIFTHAMDRNSLYNRLIITKPEWTDNPLNPRKLLPAIQFMAFLLIAYGIGGLTGTLFHTHSINSISVFIISGGTGILIGMYLTLWNKFKQPLIFILITFLLAWVLGVLRFHYSIFNTLFQFLLFPFGWIYVIIENKFMSIEPKWFFRDEIVGISIFIILFIFQGLLFYLVFLVARKINGKATFLLFFITVLPLSTFAQTLPKEYYSLVKKADSLFNVKDYKASASTYSAAFKILGWKGIPDDRYNAACAWALAGNPDSAFFNLERIATKSSYRDYDHISSDSGLISLHNDKRWQPLLDIIKQNKEKAEANLNKPLALILDSIFNDDQVYRRRIDKAAKEYGDQSKEVQELQKIIREKDSINLLKVTAILDKYGWLGRDVAGDNGSIALFLVIQHTDLKTQEKYLPMMRDAVKNGKASASNLALLIDRIEMRNNRPQIYGSQVTMKDGKYVIYPIIDEANVNQRRAEVGLQPLEEYVKRWDIEYKIPSK